MMKKYVTLLSTGLLSIVMSTACLAAPQYEEHGPGYKQQSNDREQRQNREQHQNQDRRQQPRQEQGQNRQDNKSHQGGSHQQAPHPSQAKQYQAQQRQGPQHQQHKMRPSQNWKVGGKVPPAYYSNNYKVGYHQHKLPKPGKNQRWIRVNGDYVLENILTHAIIRILEQ